MILNIFGKFLRLCCAETKQRSTTLLQQSPAFSCCLFCRMKTRYEFSCGKTRWVSKILKNVQTSTAVNVYFVEELDREGLASKFSINLWIPRIQLRRFERAVQSVAMDQAWAAISARHARDFVPPAPPFFVSRGGAALPASLRRQLSTFRPSTPLTMGRSF